MADKKRKSKKTNKKENLSKEYKTKNKKPQTKKKKIIKKVLLIALLLILILAGVAFGIVWGIAKEAKLTAKDFAIKNENSIVLDKVGTQIAELSGSENRKYITISEMAPYLPEAFISIEDERFREHMGVDVKRTLAATAKYALSKIGIGSSSYGGSTITQQLVKNTTQEKDRTWQRKVKEIARAYYIEKELSKDQILELYLNLIFMGNTSYGVEVGSNYYFSKSAKDLDLAECAFLAGINNSPNSYNPFVEDEAEREENLNRIKRRTKTVIEKMHELGKINSEEEYKQALEKVENGLTFKQGAAIANVYSYHTDAAILQIERQIMEEKDMTREAAELYLYSGGFTIYTTQDSSIQATMNEEMQKEKYLKASKKEAGKTAQAGMVLLDHKTGYVLGVIGGLGEKTTSMGLNRGTQAVRQTGSSMKPLSVVAPGIENGTITAASVYDDVPYKNYKNYDWSYRGLLNIRYSIEISQNIPMLKAIQTVGVENSLKFLKNLGFSHLDDEADNNIGIALGGLTNGATPLEMAAAYATIANDGVYIEPTFYTKVVDGDGNTVFTPKQETRTVMSASAAYVVKEVLTQPVKSGTSTTLAMYGMSVAAKTGTTNNDFDRWLCGFTPYYTAATWYGYDTSETVTGWSLSPSTQIWGAVMKSAHTGLEKRTFAQTRPAGVVSATVCRDSGLLAGEHCTEDPRGDRTYTEYFVQGTAPTKKCECHVKVDICKETGLLANEYCPDKESKVFITRPNSDTGTSWKSAKDAEYMLTIKDTCAVHKEQADTVKPEIKLNGNATITVNINEEYKDAGATATDNKDGDLTNKIQISGKVDTSKTGTYTITYTVEDSAGNKTTVTRTIIVKESTSTGNENSISGGNNSTSENTEGNQISNATTNTTTNITNTIP